MSKIVVALGDSNTRFWIGDAVIPGPLRDAWPAQLEGLLNAAGISAKVRNEGQPGAKAQMAAEDFGFFTGGADLCILGLGTNDLLGGGVLDQYLERMGKALDTAKVSGVATIVLGLPWFEADAGAAGAQEALPVWDEALKALCAARNVPFVALLESSAQDPDLWFNEVGNPKAHLSAVAQHEVAELVLPFALEILK